MLLAVNQISELTGRDRHGIPKRLENLPFTPGDKDERQHADFLQVHRLVAKRSGFDFRAMLFAVSKLNSSFSSARTTKRFPLPRLWLALFAQ